MNACPDEYRLCPQCHKKFISPSASLCHSCATRNRWANKRNPHNIFVSRMVLKRKLLLEQHGRCAVCATPLPEMAAFLDYNHQTRMVRGVVCLPCTSLIGRIEKSMPQTERVLDYIRLAPTNIRPIQYGEKHCIVSLDQK